VPLRFACRQEGASKLSPGVAWDYAMMIADKLIGHIVPVRLVAFAIVGIGALSLHLAAMAALVAGGSDVIVAHAIATALALLAVYTIDNLIAHKPRPRRGLRWAGGLIGFAATSAIGALASVGIAMAAQAQGSSWAAGAVAGTLALLVWNYGAAARYSWRAA
jgi:dolichol-phosphate mannosyltransferase